MHMNAGEPATLLVMAPPRTARPWTFLTNHGHVLIHIHRYPDARVRDIAGAVGITERAVQTVLRELEADGYLEKERVGRRNVYRVHPELAFRHPLESGKPVSDLLRIFDA